MIEIELWLGKNAEGLFGVELKDPVKQKIKEIAPQILQVTSDQVHVDWLKGNTNGNGYNSKRSVNIGLRYPAEPVVTEITKRNLAKALLDKVSPMLPIVMEQDVIVSEMLPHVEIVFKAKPKEKVRDIRDIYTTDSR